jgi:hypothetical protein
MNIMPMQDTHLRTVQGPVVSNNNNEDEQICEARANVGRLNFLDSK